MKKVFVIAACLSVWACGNEQQSEDNTTEQPGTTTEQVAEQTVAQNVDAAAFSAKLEQEDVQLVDVRTPQEWEQGVIGNPVKANIQAEDFEQKLAELDKNKPVLVYCASGGRSGRAMQMMKEKGFTEVYNLEGGINTWRQQDMPVNGN